MKSEVLFALDDADWPALLVDSSGNVRRANRAAVSTFGTGIESEASLAATIWSPENDAKVEQFLARLDRAIEPTVPLKFRVKGGTSVLFLSYVCPLTREGQKLFLFQLFRQDLAAPTDAKTPPAPTTLGQELAIGSVGKPLTARHEPPEGALAEESSAGQKQKLDCALQLARTVALDFNNALTSILGHASLVLSKMESGHPWRHSLLEVEKSAERAAEVANNLAAFSRQEKDTQAVAEGDLNQLLQRTVTLFQSSTPQRIQWALQLEHKLYSVNVDEAKMQQAFVKILENAVEAVGPAGSIRVQTRNLELTGPKQDGSVRLAPGNYVCVEIADSGCGIEAAVLPRIFEPFFTTKRDPKHRGLGLAWVYGIVTNHGGSVAVSSQPGRGTTVRAYLPALKKVIKPASLPQENLSGDQTILVVDDEDLLLTMAETVLADFGYRVLTAKSGEQALEIFSAGLDIDLLITDMVMPGMSGRELITLVRRLAPKIRIICASGYVRAQQTNEGEVYLQKPFASQDLLRKVKEALAS
ncbi:MAG: response regulator [Verrucomicrobia bacterium]|nr:response regulator [Verrucomicrobiota bacterium]